MDAVVIRMAVVPAVMFLIGRANWWFPGWLDRILPHLSVDPDLPSEGQGPPWPGRTGRVRAGAGLSPAARPEPVPRPYKRGGARLSFAST